MDEQHTHEEERDEQHTHEEERDEEQPQLPKDTRSRLNSPHKRAPNRGEPISQRSPARPLFRPDLQTYVAARPFRWAGTSYECGDPVPKKPGTFMPPHYLRRLYHTGQIGPKNHPWTESSIKRWHRKLEVARERQALKLARREELRRARAEREREPETEPAEPGPRSLRDQVAGILGREDAGPGSADHQ